MSINSFFNTRKSRNKNSIETNQFKQDVNVVSNFAAQAPQPIYEQLIKPTTVATTTNAEPLCKKSILYYLSPIKKNAEKDIGSVEETSLPCRIRTSIPVSLLWKDILEDFDPDSQPNQFSLDSRLLLQPETMDISSRLENKRRILQDNDVTRNVRIRTRTYPVTLNQSMSLEDYLLEDTQEDLSRPLRMKLTSNETNAFLLQIVDEVIILSDNRWFLNIIETNN
ncbi:hypothetical protein MFLAVUS_002968 [Mucor flavus]|uniref:Uncharacterized protein n=1 Tax=Mucor flavus TaxID=439312 RepID=A0ABP9YRT4_9FUNG